MFVPGALPGEQVRVSLPERGAAAVLEAVLRASPERADPPCRLFGACGGCVLQHMSDAAIARFKQRLVSDALVGAGFILPDEIGFHASPPASRRRMDLALRRTPTEIRIGLHRRAGDVVDLLECHVLEPALFALIERLRPVLLRLTCLRATGSAIVNLLECGPDLLLATDRTPGTEDRARLAAFARSAGLPRIAWRPLKGGDGGAETICLLAPVTHALSGGEISPPPGAFLQATRAGEAAIVASVLAGLPATLEARARIVELYAGCGTLSFALARRGRVLAFEGRQEAVACLVRGVASGMRLEARLRDLVRQPLRAAEFAQAAAVVLDPPFAGAGLQMAEIARAGVPRVILVSCNPVALGRDAAPLQRAGYRLEQLSVIDQFLWSGAVESVALFVMPKQTGSRAAHRTRTA